MGRAAALCAAGVLAIWTPLRTLRSGEWRATPAPPAWADAAFAEVGPAPGERIVLLIPAFGPGGREEALWYAAQYALVPGLVQPVKLRDCLGSDGPQCRIEGPLRVVAPLADPALVAAIQRRFRLETTGVSGSLLQLRRVEPR